MDKLTVKKLKEMKPDTMFAKGTGYIPHPWFAKHTYKRKTGAYKTVTPEGLTKVKWVAMRGGIHDWAVYHSLDSNFELADHLDGDSHLKVSYKNVAKWGAKLHDADLIRELIPCNDAAFAVYRH